MKALRLVPLAAAVVLASSAAAQAEPRPAAGPPDGFTFAAGGDLLGPYHASDAGQAMQAQAPVAALFRAADVGFANQEGSIFDLKDFSGAPAAENGGGYPLQAPFVAQLYREMGLTLVSKANNHATDWGPEGLEATLKSLAADGVVQAGAGLGPQAARAPGFLETPRGRAALVDVASTFPPMAVAGPAVERRGMTSKARYGIAPLHVRAVRLVPAAQIETLRRIAGDLAYAAGPGEVRVDDQVFRASPRSGSTWTVDPVDRAATLDSVRRARAQARFVLFSIHAHETAGHADTVADYEPMILHHANEAASAEDTTPADFEPALFHAAIDAGADAVVRTGPHRLGPIEIYQGKPIFYSLGSLFFDFGKARSYTSATGQVINFPPEWFETVVPVVTYKGGVVSEIRLHPMVLESSEAPTAGFPSPADPQASLRILERLRKLSAPYGVDLRIEGGVGVIRPGR